MRQSIFRGRNWLVAMGLATALAGCDTVSMNSGAGIAEQTENTETASVNIGSLTEVINRNPNDPQAYNTRGAAYARIGRYSDAISDFQQGDPARSEFRAAGFTNRALALRQTGRNDAALQDFNRATTANQNYGPAYVGRANLLRAQGNSRRRWRTSHRDPPQPRNPPRRSMRAGWSTRRKASTSTRSPISTSPSDRNPYNALPDIARVRAERPKKYRTA